MVDTEMTRMPEKAVHDVAQLYALLDSQYVAHIGLVRDGRPFVVPTGIARDGDRVLAHGSTGSPWMRRLAAGSPTCLAVTALDGLVVARSAFESSFQYRSAVVFGRFAAVEGDAKLRALEVVTNTFIPGRWDEVRAASPKELAATLVLALPIEQWSLRVSEDWPEDPLEDVEGDAWAGVVPMRTVLDAPLPAPDLRPGIGVPASVRALTGG